MILCPPCCDGRSPGECGSWEYWTHQLPLHCSQTAADLRKQHYSDNMYCAYYTNVWLPTHSDDLSGLWHFENFLSGHSTRTTQNFTKERIAVHLEHLAVSDLTEWVLFGNTVLVFVYDCVISLTLHFTYHILQCTTVTTQWMWYEYFCVSIPVLICPQRRLLLSARFVSLLCNVSLYTSNCVSHSSSVILILR